jgi:hypothetical protein
MSRKIEEGLKNWDYLFSGITEQEDINKEEKKEIVKNWWQLRTNLGEDWLKNEKNDEHPLKVYYLFNRATFLRGFFQSRSFVALIMNYGWRYHC